MGGNGQQLVVQLLWLVSIVCWSLLFTVPVCVVLQALGILVYAGVHTPAAFLCRFFWLLRPFLLMRYTRKN